MGNHSQLVGPDALSLQSFAARTDRLRLVALDFAFATCEATCGGISC